MTDYVVPVLPRRPREQYINTPSRLQSRPSAKRRGWFAGWPDNCPTAAARTNIAVVRPQDGRTFNMSVDTRLAHLFRLFLEFSQDVGDPLIGAQEVNANGGMQGGIGSYVCRAIKGSNPPQPSNHSSATALDLYTRSNPMRIGRLANGQMGAPVTFVSTIHPHMVELGAAADLYWGGWYWDRTHPDTGNHYYVDAMHFEYMKRPQDVEQSVIRLKNTYADIKKRLEPEEPEDPEFMSEDIKLVQNR
jgi:hypothetical protein